jgi:hypothetical protein
VGSIGQVARTFSARSYHSPLTYSPLTLQTNEIRR